MKNRWHEESENRPCGERDRENFRVLFAENILIVDRFVREKKASEEQKEKEEQENVRRIF